MIQEFLIGFATLIGYFVLCVLTILLLRRWLRPPQELFRKILHFVLLLSLPVLIYAFPTWRLAALAAVLFALLVFPALSLGERIQGYAELLIERRSGEIKESLLLVFSMFAVMITCCWGWLGDKMLVLACVYAWGFGDAVAALIGKRFGRHGLEGRLIEGRKSVEGTLAMFIVSFLAVAIILWLRGGLPWYGYLPVAATTAAVSAAVELYTRKGYDTVTCPLAAAAVLLPLVWMWGGLSL